MGISTVIATLHDPIVILGFFAVTQITFDLAVLAAMLAVIGYSLNDTVVVFDRVRESLPQDAQGDAEEVMDAVDQPDAVAHDYDQRRDAARGGRAADHSAARRCAASRSRIIVGVVVGTYSSIFVAGALALDMKLSAHDLMRAEGNLQS